MRKTHGSKGVNVVVNTTGLALLATRLNGQGVDAAMGSVEEDVQGFVEAARAAWGVETGQGRESLRAGAHRGNPAQPLFIVNAYSDYFKIRFQRPVASGKGPTYWQRLVRDPLSRNAPKILDKAAAAMVEAADG